MSAARVLHRDQVVSAVRERRRLGAAPLDVRCDSVHAVMYRDVIETYLWFTGTRRARWLDPAGGERVMRGPGTALAGLLRDLLCSLPALWRASRRVARLEREAATRARADSLGRALYVRSDHWFNLATGGSVAHTRGVIGSLRAHGVDTVVVSTGRLRGVADDEQFCLCAPHYHLGRNVPGLPELLYNEQAVAAVTQACDEQRPDFLYERLSFLGYAGAAVARARALPLVCEYNGSPAWAARHWGSRPAPLERLALRVEQLVLRRADLVVVVSDAIREQLLAQGIEADRILVNPNGVDTDVYRPDVPAAAVRARLGLGERLVFGFIGTFGRWHGAEVLAHAFARLLEQQPSLRDRVRLLMIGDGSERAACERVLAAAGVTSEAVFTGSVPHEDGPAHLAACDVLVSPHVPNADGSRFFGSPTKLFEYLAMGRPVVASSLEQIGEILVHERTALLVPPSDADALAQAMWRLVGDAALRETLAREGRELAVSRYTWDAHTGRILDALACLVGRPPSCTRAQAAVH